MQEFPELVQPFLLRSAKAVRNKQGECTNFLVHPVIVCAFWTVWRYGRDVNDYIWVKLSTTVKDDCHFTGFLKHLPPNINCELQKRTRDMDGLSKIFFVDDGQLLVYIKRHVTT